MKNNRKKSRIPVLSSSLKGIALLILAVSGLLLLQSPLADHTPPGDTAAADINADGVINIFDLSYLLSNWKSTDQVADVNGDGRVDIFDLSIMLSQWGHTVQGGEAPRNHSEAVDRIQTSTFRNKTMDSSPFINTPSAQLINQPSLYESNPSIYNRITGTFGTVPFLGDTLFPGSASSPNGATFRANCEVSHFSYDDPIVFPAQPEKAHLHMFLGNTQTNAYTTYDSLLNSGSSTCNGKELNRTAYWVPAMMDGNGNAIVPFNTKFYYKTERNAGPGRVSTYPDNLQIVADNTNNNGGDINTAVFRCNDIWNGGKRSGSNTIPTCFSTENGQPGALEYQIYFDYCWNGDTSSVGDWEANRDRNLVPPNNNWFTSQCPSSHPNMLPALVTHIFYDIPPGTDTSKWHLSSDVNSNTGRVEGGRGASAHADWFGGWNKDINKEFVDNCSNVAGAACGEGYLRNAANNQNAKALVLREDWDAGQIHSIPLQQIYEQMCSASSTRPYSSANGGASAAYCQPHGN